MAKKPVEKVEEEVVNNLDLVKLNKEFPGVLINGDFLVEHPGKTISTGLLSFDIALNSGLREGVITHIGGLTGSGKTTLSLTFAVQAQKDGRNVYHVDVEGRLQPELLQCIEGLDLNKYKIIRSSADKFLNAEEYLTIIETILKDDPGCMIIIDSIAALSCEAEQVGGMADMQRANMAKLLYKFLRKVAQIIPVNKNILISLTHIQANPSGYGLPTKDVGGNGIHFFSSNVLMCTNVEKIDEDGKKIGINSKFKISKVAGGAPDAEPVAYIRYSRGCDKYIDIANIAEEMGLILKGGAWYELKIDEFKIDDKYPKFQGQKNLINWLRQEGRAEKVDQMIRSMVFPDK